MKEDNIQTLMTVKVVAVNINNIGIINMIVSFYNENIQSLKIKECIEKDMRFTVVVDIIVNGEYDECISVLQDMNMYLTEEDFFVGVGYLEIITIPSEMETIYYE